MGQNVVPILNGEILNCGIDFFINLVTSAVNSSPIFGGKLIPFIAVTDSCRQLFFGGLGNDIRPLFMSPIRDHIAFAVKFVTEMGSEFAPLDGVKLFPIKILREEIGESVKTLETGMVFNI